MNIFYTNNTLYVNLEERIDEKSIMVLRRRIFGILDDYDIDNIVINVITFNNNNFLLDDFINEYHQKYSGKLIVR